MLAALALSAIARRGPAARGRAGSRLRQHAPGAEGIPGDGIQPLEQVDRLLPSRSDAIGIRFVGEESVILELAEVEGEFRGLVVKARCGHRLAERAGALGGTAQDGTTEGVR